MSKEDFILMHISNCTALIQRDFSYIADDSIMKAQIRHTILLAEQAWKLLPDSLKETK